MNSTKLMRHILFSILLVSGNTFASDNIIVVGVTKFAPPFSTMDSKHHYSGFCVDLANAICKCLNVICQYKPVTPENQLVELNEGRIDIAFTPQPIPQAASLNYIYSLPYITSNGQFLTLDPSIKSLKDLKNKRIGTLQQGHLNDILLYYTSKDNIKEYSDPGQLITSLPKKEVDAIILNVNVVKFLTNNKIINFRSIGQPIILGNGYGIVALPKNDPLISRINKALLQIENDGTYTVIYNKYFGY